MATRGGGNLPQNPRLWVRLARLLGITVCIRALFILLRHPAAVAFDLTAWQEVVGHLNAGVNPYVVTPYLSWPPLWAQLLMLCGRISAIAGIPLTVVIQSFLVLVEAALVAVTLKLLTDGVGAQRAERVVLFGIAINPVCVLLTSQHGNFDALVGLLVLLALTAVIRYERERQDIDWLLGCLYTGIGALAKTIPLVLAPLMLSSGKRVPWRGRALGAALIALPGIYGLSTLAVLSPPIAMQRVLGYTSIPGWFGITGLLQAVHWDVPSRVYSRCFLIILGAAAIAVFFRGRNAETMPPRQLLGSALLLLSLIPAIGPGYGPQYVWWFWPLVVIGWAMGSRWTRRAAGWFIATAALTYSVEYAFAPALGAFAVKGWSGALVSASSAALGNPAKSTVYRLPLFLAYLVLIAACIHEVFLAPGPESAKRLDHAEFEAPGLPQTPAPK